MSIRFIYILICFFFTGSTLAQNYNYQHYNLDNGLSGLTVYSIAQDKDGFIWFATETGLSRFDGTNFKNFTTADGLPDNEVLKLYVDSKNRVWILPFSHAICYYKNGKIYTGSNDSSLAKLKLGSEPTDIYEDKSGNTIVIENKAIHIIAENSSVVSYDRIEGKKFITLGIGVNAKQNILISAMLEEKSARWGVLELTGTTLNSYQIKSASTRFIGSQFILLRNHLQAFRKFDKLHIQIKDTVAESLLNIPEHFIGMSFISDSTFTLNCSDTVFLYNVNRKEIVDRFSLGKIINTCFRDIEGNYWFATTGYGVYRLGSIAFTNYNLVNQNNLLPVYSLYKQGDYLLSGTSQSLLWSLNLSNKTLLKERVAEDVGEARITGIFKEKGKLIVGSGQGIHYYSGKKKDIIVEDLNIKNISHFEDSLLVTTNRNVLKMSIHNPLIADTIWKERATCAYKFNNAFYIGTLNGLYRVNGDRTILFLGTEDSLFTSRISSITQSGDTLWIAAYGNGVIAYCNNKIINHITENNGLTSNTCRVLYKYDGNLWAGTDKGLNKISLHDCSYKISTYTSKDGLNCDIINCLLVENDTIFIGTPYGLILFNPANVAFFSISNLHINSINSAKYTWDGLQKSISLDAGDNRFSVNYSGISFKSDGNMLYHYRLTGLDDEWHTTRENILDFASLTPGNYILQLYAVNAFGVKSNIVTISLIVNKFFYQQLWFVILLVIFASLLLWYFISKQIRAIKKNENEKLQTHKRLSELEQLAFRAQMNPHFIFNCLNSIQQYIFTKNVLDANNFITAFSSLIRQTMELSAKKTISLDEEVKYLSTYLKLEHIRFEENFDYSIAVAEQLTPESIYMPPLLLQPFVENSIRHGIRNLKEKKGNISVEFSVKDNILFCKVVDNGIGRTASQKLRKSNEKEHKSKGLSLIQKRIEVLNSENERQIILIIEDVFLSVENTGTRVTLQIPM